MEHLVDFKLAIDPPPDAAKNLLPGAKTGDPVGMINVAVLWWNEKGKIKRELEYGRLTWDQFDADVFDPK